MKRSFEVKWFLFGAVTAMAVAGAAWFVMKPVPKTPSAPTSSAQPTDATLSPVSLAEAVLASDAPGCGASATYVTIAPEAQLPAHVRNAINARITEVAVSFFAGPGDDMTPPPDTVEEAMGKWSSLCQESQGESVGDGYDAAWYNMLSYSVSLNNGSVLSIGLHDEVFEGGTHPNGWNDYLTFDLQTGKEWLLEDVVTSEHRVVFAEQLATRLLGMRDVLYEETISELERYLADPRAENLDLVLSKGWKYSLTENTITIHYNPYQIAPYVAGPIDIELPRP